MDQYLALGVFALISFSVLCAPMLLGFMRSTDQKKEETEGLVLSRQHPSYDVLIVIFLLCTATLLFFLPVSCVFTLSAWRSLMLLFIFSAAACVHVWRKVLGGGR